MLPCRPPHRDRCMRPCRPPHPDHHGQCSPGCPWHPCSICVARAGRVCRPTLHHGHTDGVEICGSAKTSAPPQGSARAHQVCGRLSWQRPLKVSARRGERCTHRPWTSDLSSPLPVKPTNSLENIFCSYLVPVGSKLKLIKSTSGLKSPPKYFHLIQLQSSRAKAPVPAAGPT